jgi:hypothetical protein
MDPNAYRPTLRSVVTIFAGLALILVVALVFRNDAVTALATLLICGGYVAWTFWDNRYK